MEPSQGNVWSAGGDDISAVINFQQQTRRFLFNLGLKQNDSLPRFSGSSTIWQSPAEVTASFSFLTGGLSTSRLHCRLAGGKTAGVLSFRFLTGGLSTLLPPTVHCRLTIAAVIFLFLFCLTGTLPSLA